MDALSPEEQAKFQAYLDDLNRKYQIYYPVAFWVEAIIYGLYCAMFLSTMRIMTRKRPAETVASRIFLIVSILIFILCTIHNITSISRLIRAYALLYAPPAPYMYFQLFTEWDNYAHLIVLALTTWLGDYLVIYRCFLIWRRNKWVIVLPTLLLIGSIGTTFVNWYWFRHPEKFTWEQIQPVFNVTFPLNLAQNVLTTGLISWKIYKQHRETVASGLQVTAGLNLMGVIRIIVESAMIYTVETALIIILFVLNHPAVVIVQGALCPSTGIVFCLIAIRTHVARTDSFARPSGYTTASNAFFPSWVANDPDGMQRINNPNRHGVHKNNVDGISSLPQTLSGGRISVSRNHRNQHHMAMGPITVTTVTEQHRWDDSIMMSPTSMSDSRGRGRKDDEMTMDVDMDDLEGDYKDGGRTSSPGSIRTFEARKG